MAQNVNVHKIVFSDADDQLLRTAEKNALTPSRWLSGYGLQDVAVTDPWLLNAGEKEISYLLSFDVRRLLVEFRAQAGLPTDGVKNYGGWESGEDETTNPPDANPQDGASHPHRFTGHFVGHWLTACCQAYRSRIASPEQHRELGERVTALVQGVREAQLAYAKLDPANAGFLPAFAVTALPGGADGLMVPFYNLHKVLQGLVTASQLGPDRATRQAALSAASNFAAFLLEWSGAHPDADLLTIEYGGMNDALYQLFEITGNPDHARAAHLFDEVPLFRSIASGDDVLPGLHANTTIPKFIGALQRVVSYAAHPDALAALPEGDRADLTKLYLRAAVRFWQMVTAHHSYANGDNSGCEHFHDPDHLFTDATGGDDVQNACASETCNAYNMLKLTRLLLRLTASPRLADYYGLTFCSTILPSQNPVTGMSTYYQAVKAGYSKVFGRPFGDFWCCQGTGVENFTKLGDSLWFARDDESDSGCLERMIYMAGFASSRLSDRESGLAITVSAHSPQSSHVAIDVAQAGDGSAAVPSAQARDAAAAPRPRRAVLELRIPDWADAGHVALVLTAADGTRHAIDASAGDEQGWISVPIEPGTHVDADVPARLSIVRDRENPDWVAFRDGPVLLSADLGERAGGGDPDDSGDISNSVWMGIATRCAKYSPESNAESVIAVTGMSLDEWASHPDKALERIRPDIASQTGSVSADSHEMPHASAHDAEDPSTRTAADDDPRHLAFCFRHVAGPAARLVLRPHFLQYRGAYAASFTLREE